MAPAERLQRQFAFLVECDRLKDILRQTHNAYSGRQENDAERSWALCLFLGRIRSPTDARLDVRALD